MGNRCVVTTKAKDKALYFHWNGGKDTILPLTKVARQLWRKDLESDKDRFDFFSEVAITVFDAEPIDYNEADTDNGDNGVYVLDENLRIIAREFAPKYEQKEHDFTDMLAFIIVEYLSKKLENRKAEGVLNDR